MIKLQLGDRAIELVPTDAGIYKVPISARYHPSIGEFQKANNAPNFTLDTILRNLGLVPATRVPAGDFELWKLNVPTQTAPKASDGAERFNLSGNSDTFGSSHSSDRRA